MRVLRGRDKEEGQGRRPAMRWVSMGSLQQPEAAAAAQARQAGGAGAQPPPGRAIMRASPGAAAGVSFSFTDTSVPQAGDRRRAQAPRPRALLLICCSPLRGRRRVRSLRSAVRSMPAGHHYQHILYK